MFITWTIFLHFLNKRVAFSKSMIYNIIMKKGIDFIFERILANSSSRVPLANVLSSFSGVHQGKLLELAIEMNKYRRTGSYPNYKMISTLLCAIPEEDAKQMVGHIRVVRFGETIASADERMAFSLFKDKMSSLPKNTMNEKMEGLIAKHIRLRLIPNEIVLNELKPFFTISELSLMMMVVREYNSRAEDTINTISLLSSEHRRQLRENRKKERDRLLYEYEEKEKIEKTMVGSKF